MGHLNVFNIQELMNKYNLTHYIETGTGEGLTLSQALCFNFKSLHSIECNEVLYNNALQKFNDSRVTIHKGMSREVLPTILGPIEENILFFLDAHFPGSDFNLGPAYKDSITVYGRDALPLRDEIEAILNIRNNSKDVFIIDDLRIYEEGNYETGNWLERSALSIENSSFVYEIFKNTHSIQTNLKNQGYLIVEPICA